MENQVWEDFATRSEVEQTMLLGMLGSSGYKDRDWWYRALTDEPTHRSRPTF